jgi:integrase
MHAPLADLPPQRTVPAEPPDWEGAAHAPSGTLVPLAPAELVHIGPAQVAAEIGQAEVYRERAHTLSTLKAYRSDWAHFAVYCADRGARPLPADPLVVRTYLSYCADRLGLKVSTLQRRVAAIAHFHRQAGQPLDTNNDAFRETWRGIRRTHGVAPEEKAPTVTEEVKAMVERLPATLVGVRDRALLLLGFAGAFRRSELCALDVADIVVWDQDGIRLRVRTSKTDQEGAGLLKDIPYAQHPEFCPVRSLRDWLDLAEIDVGPLFRPLSKAGRVLPRRLTDQWVDRTLKRAITPVAAEQAERAWARLSATQQQRHDREVWRAEYVRRVVARYAGHSLRAGFVTSAAAAGARVDEIMDQTGHTRVDTLMRYVRNARAIRAGAAAKLGL